MASTAETGHAKNVANLKKLISKCIGYGARYNPTNNLIKIPNMQSVQIASATSLTTVNTTRAPYTQAVNTRSPLFQEMEKLAGRAKNALDATENVEDNLVEDAMTYLRKIRGARKNKIDVPPPPADSTAIEIAKQISVSQQSYDQQVQHFSKLRTLLASVLVYMPNETELQPAQLLTTENQLIAANDAVTAAATPYTNALQSRDNVMYAKKTGLVDIALEAKNYVKSVKTITPAEFRQISGLTFRRPPKKK